MTIASILDTIIAVILIITIASLLVTTLHELSVEILQRRSKRLYQAIKLALDNSGQSELTDSVFSSALLKNSWGGDSPLNPSDHFDNSFLSIFSGPRAPINIDPEQLAQILLSQVKSYRDSELSYRPTLKELWEASGKNEEKFLELTQKWAKEIFQNISAGNQKRRKTWYFGIGLALCVAFNINVITIADKVSQKNDLRYLIERAQVLAQTGGSDEATTTIALQQNAAGYFRDLLNLSIHIGLESTDVWCDNDPTTFLELNVNALNFIEENVSEKARKKLTAKFEAYCDNAADSKEDDESADSAPIVKWYNYLKSRLTLESAVNIIGYLLTALLLSLGSDFWLSLLKKSLSIRARVYGVTKKLPAAKAQNST